MKRDQKHGGQRGSRTRSLRSAVLAAAALLGVLVGCASPPPSPGGPEMAPAPARLSDDSVSRSRAPARSASDSSLTVPISREEALSLTEEVFQQLRSPMRSFDRWAERGVVLEVGGTRIRRGVEERLAKELSAGGQAVDYLPASVRVRRQGDVEEIHLQTRAIGTDGGPRRLAMTLLVEEGRLVVSQLALSP